MKLMLSRTTLMLVTLFTLSITALGHESNKTPTVAPDLPILEAKKINPDATRIQPSVITMADIILAEQEEAEARNLRAILKSQHNPKATIVADSLVDEWLEEHAGHAHGASEAQPRAHSHVHYQEIGMEMGGGWCDFCSCWIPHGDDPNGTPEEQIGHSYVCGSGPSCSRHQYRNCYSS